MRSEAAFADLAGAAPVPPASSGLTTRHRLDHGGDRQPDRALRTVVLVRPQRDPATRADAERRRAEGKTPREISGARSPTWPASGSGSSSRGRLTRHRRIRSPVEEAFSKLKTSPRAAGARTRPALDVAIGRATDAVTPADAAGWFAHCGYRPAAYGQP